MQEKRKRYLDLYLPRPFTLKYGWIYFLGVSVYILLSLNFQHPFGEYTSNMPHHHCILSCFGCVFTLMFLVFYAVLPRIFKQYFDKNNWTLNKELCNLILLYLASCLANRVCVLLTFSPDYDTLTYFTRILSFTFTFNLLPVIVVTLIQLVLYMVQKFVITKQNEPVKSIDLFYCANGKAITMNDILFFYQSGNYQFIVYLLNGKLAEEKERRSMQVLIQIMLPYTQFKPSNASFMINTDKIEYCVKECGKKKLKIIGYHKILNVSYAHRHDFDQFLPGNRE
jgi:hypothetical protein